MTRPKASHRETALQRISAATHHDPFEVLGCHPLAHTEETCRVLVFLPGATAVSLETREGLETMQAHSLADFYEWVGNRDLLDNHYRVTWEDASGFRHWRHDPYTFWPQLTDYDLHLFGEGRHWQIYKHLGAHRRQVDGVDGVLFATWAPGAERVSVVGNFNRWDGRCHPMRCRGGSGVWELFIPDIAPGEVYKFEIRTRQQPKCLVKTDPYGQQFERRPATAAIVTDAQPYKWEDSQWMEKRHQWHWQSSPLSVYELHLGSWRRPNDREFYNYRELAPMLVEYLQPLGFTHVEVLPLSEHPLDDSWGYQCTGYFAPTSRFGAPDDLRFFVDYLHRHNIGVILDWVPAHFPRDEFSLARFDGTALYEHEDPRRGEHRDWGTLIFNYGRNEVRNFLIASALYWLEEFHIDGLRVDAVASMIHLDYSREDGEWIPNQYGGNENLEAVAFLRELNIQCHGQHPGALVIAEESTAWPQVSGPVYLGGLGFSLKWNMGWMHDTLEYMRKDPVHRTYHHDKLTFGLMYAFSENFQLPFSHDEVVHGKSSLLGKMPGDDWQKFANLRLLYAFQWTYPGSKLLFMGSEFGQWSEWNHHRQLDWALRQYPLHSGLMRLLGDLNQLYRQEPALYEKNYQSDGFAWIDCHDTSQSILSFLRCGDQASVIILLNFTPVVREDYRVGVPEAGVYRELFNSDSSYYGGSDVGNGGGIYSEDKAWMNLPASLSLTLPPLGCIILKRQ